MVMFAIVVVGLCGIKGKEQRQGTREDQREQQGGKLFHDGVSFE